MIRDFRASIMAPIGEPINITGFNPIFNRPEPFVRPLPPMQPPQLPPVTPPPILPPVTPPVIPPQPPSIGGIGGINQDLRPLERPIIPPKRNDFISINRVNSDDLRQRQALGLTGVPGVGSNNFGGTPLGQQPIVMDSGPQTTGIRALKDTRDYANMTDDEIRKIMGPNPTVPGRSPKPISQEQIDEFRFDKLNPGMLFEMIQNRDISPDDYDDPLAKKIATRLQESERKRREFFENNPVTPPVAPPPPDGTPENPFPLQPILPAPTDDRARLPGPPLQATPAPTIDPVIEPAPTTPAAVATDVGAVPDTTMPIGAIDPVLLQQATAETLTDPLIRSLYFGTADSPGFFQQLRQAGANLIGSDVPLQQTAGLTPLEVLARQQAVAGIGGFEPFLQQNRELVNQAIAQSRRAEQLQDPYYTQAEQIYQDTMGAYDPSMTQQFFNPFEDAVVQQTISDVLEAGEQQDIAARAREIGAGAFGGSRARLGAMERREALGEGLAQALGRIRQQGFSEAQRTGLGEFARQQQAKRTGAQGLIGIGTGRGSAAGNLAQRLAGFGGQMTDLGRTQEQLRSGQRRELAGFGTTGRGIEETGLSRLFEQQLGQQLRPIQTLGQIGAMLPGYQASRTQIDSQYGMPTDPTAAGLGAAFSAYGALAPRQGSS
jgi:hypothetical protein